MKVRALSCNHWFFGIVKILKNAIVLQVNEVFAKHGFNAHVIIYVKEEGGDLLTMTIILISIVSCRVLGFAIPSVRSCWGHVKSCQHAKYGFEVYVSLTSISILKT
jgi:hypothetical protein